MNFPTFNRDVRESAKYNHIMGRDCPTGTTDRTTFERLPWMNWELENSRMPWDRRFDGFDRFDRRFDGFNHFDRRFDGFGFDRFDRRWENSMMPWENRWENRFDRRWEMPTWDRKWEGRTMPWGFDNLNRNVEGRFDWMNTMYNTTFRPTHHLEYYTLTNPIRVLDREGNRELHLCFDLRGYKPEEITCTFNRAERCITVEAGYEVKEGKEHHVMRKYMRKFYLPISLAKVDFTKCEIKCCLFGEGLLHCELPLPKMTTEEIAKCPMMTKMITTPYYNGSYYGYGCPSTCNTTPINCKNL